MVNLKNFKINEKYLTSVHTKEQKLLTFINPITGTPIVTGTFELQGSKDHPQFTRLRNYLADKGYIKLELNWWNGDIVLKSFKINNYLFKEHDPFYCGSALGIAIKCKRR